MSTTERHHRLAFRVRSLLGDRRKRDARSALRGAALRHGCRPAARRTPPEPYVTITVGGPLNGIVALTASDAPRAVVEAIWGGYNWHGISLTRPSEGEALILADSWANQLIDGHEPTHDLLR